jgi:hypothetical protein
MIIHFLNHATVITVEQFAILILNRRFSKTYTIFKLIYFLHSKSFFDNCVLWN